MLSPKNQVFLTASQCSHDNSVPVYLSCWWKELEWIIQLTLFECIQKTCSARMPWITCIYWLYLLPGWQNVLGPIPNSGNFSYLQCFLKRRTLLRKTCVSPSIHWNRSPLFLASCQLCHWSTAEDTGQSRFCSWTPVALKWWCSTSVTSNTQGQGCITCPTQSCTSASAQKQLHGSLAVMELW